MLHILTVLVLLAVSPRVALPMELRAPRTLRSAEGDSTLLLPCEFRSSAPLSPLLRVVWQRRDGDGSPALPVLLLEGPGVWRSAGPLRGRARWAGNLTAGSAAMVLLAPRPSDSGIYSCDVLNLPDADGEPTSTLLSVIARAPTPELTTNRTRPGLEAPPVAVRTGQREEARGGASARGVGALVTLLIGAGFLVGVAVGLGLVMVISRHRRRRAEERGVEEEQGADDGSTVTLVGAS